MDREDKELIPIIINIIFLVVSSILSGSTEIIYQYIGCWPEYGNFIVQSGMYGTILLWMLLSYYCSTYIEWLKKENTVIRNIIGYCGGMAIGGFITIIIFATTNYVIFSIYPIFHMGYVLC